MTTPEGVRAVMRRAQDKLERLRTVQPFLIDLSLRENPVGARAGQTLTDKINLLPLLRQFGFQNILLGTLDYSDPDELEVDDDFMLYLRENDHDALRGGWAFTDIGKDTGDGFRPSASMQKLVDYHVPNTLLEIYCADMPYGKQDLMKWLPHSIEWLRQNMYRFPGEEPQILINIVDGCDAFYNDLDFTCAVLRVINQFQVTGLSFEDDRGTYFPFQVGAYVEVARAILPNQKILVHMHAGGGFENASLIEAILAGADGVWGGLPKRAAIIGHASLGELLANLVRAGNQNVLAYNLSQLTPLATIWQARDDQDSNVPDDLPILGANAYRTPLKFFEQIAGRAQDLPAEVIGATQRYRICPVVSDPPVIRGRLGEVMDRDPNSFDEGVMEQMRRLMRRSLREGRRIVWDEPTALVALYHAAGGT